jgi:HEAT repeat protein
VTEKPEAFSSGEASVALDWADPSELPIEEVRDVFLTLSKALRAYQLYDPSNPVYKRFVANLRESFERVWGVRDRVQILVEQDRLTWMGEEVYKNVTRADSLAFLLYRDGIRDVTFEKGISDGEIEGLLDALNRTKNARGDREDLVSMIWDLDLKHFSYSAVEIGEGGDASHFPSGDKTPAIDAQSVLRQEIPDEVTAEEEEEPTAAAAPRPGAVSTEDFNPTLYALEPEERKYLQAELGKEMARDVRGDVLNALFDRLEEPNRPERQREILEILCNLVPNFLSRGAFREAARVAEEVGALRAKPGVLVPDVASLAEALIETLSAPEAVRELIRGMEDGSLEVDKDDLGALLRSLRPGALTSLLKGVEETRDDVVREVLKDAVQGLAVGNPGLVVDLLGSDDTSIACGAVRLAGRMKIPEAATPLARLLERGPRQVRRAIVETAVEVPSTVLAGALRRLLRDGDRELRVAAARALGAIRFAPAAEDLKAVLEDKQFHEADVTEKVAFFEAYGLLAGDSAVPLLDKILNSKGFLGRREPAEMRAGAALGLGKINSTAAKEALERSSRDDDPVVRSAVGRARRGGEASVV